MSAGAFISKGYDKIIGGALVGAISTWGLIFSILLTRKEEGYFALAFISLVAALVSVSYFLAPLYWGWMGSRSFGVVTNMRTITFYRKLDIEIHSFLHLQEPVPEFRSEQKEYYDIVYEEKRKHFTHDGEEQSSTNVFEFPQLGLFGIRDGKRVYQLIYNQRMAIAQRTPEQLNLG